MQDIFSDVVFLQQMVELQQGSAVWNLLVKEVDPEEASHGIAVIDGFFHPLVGEIETVLCEIHAEHDLDIFWPATAFVVIVVWPDDLDPLIPRNDLVHGIQECLPALFSPCGLRIPCHIAFAGPYSILVLMFPLYRNRCSV